MPSRRSRPRMLSVTESRMLRSLLHLRQARRHAATVAEEPLEHHTWIALVRQRHRRRPPGCRVEVGAAVSVLAVAHLEVRLGRQLERSQLSVRAKPVGGVLVDRLAGGDVRALGALRQHAVQPPAMRPRVDAAAFVRADDTEIAQPAHDRQLTPERLEGLQDGRQVEAEPPGPAGWKLGRYMPLGT